MRESIHILHDPTPQRAWRLRGSPARTPRPSGALLCALAARTQSSRGYPRTENKDDGHEGGNP